MAGYKFILAMIDPKDILATKVTKAGTLLLIKMHDGKPKWVWREPPEKPKDKTDNWNEFLNK